MLSEAYIGGLFMKSYYLIALTLLASCANTSSIKPTDDVLQVSEHDYSEIEDRIIPWEDLFTKESNRYYCYVFSKTCSHCNEIKNNVIDYALKNDNFFFVEYGKHIPLTDDITATIGATSIDNVAIMGTPTLLGLINHTLIENIAGSKKVLEKIQNP